MAMSPCRTDLLMLSLKLKAVPHVSRVMHGYASPYIDEYCSVSQSVLLSLCDEGEWSGCARPSLPPLSLSLSAAVQEETRRTTKEANNCSLAAVVVESVQFLLFYEHHMLYLL